MKKMNLLNRDIHQLAMYYGVCSDEAVFKAEMKRLKIAEPSSPLKNGRAGATAHFLQNNATGDEVVIVFIKIDPKFTREQHYALLVHEGAHIWQRHKELIGEDDPSDEFEAYALQRIPQSLMYEFRDLTKGFKFKQ